MNFQQSKVSSNDKPHRQFSNMRSSETSLSAILFCHQLPFIDQKGTYTNATHANTVGLLTEERKIMGTSCTSYEATCTFGHIPEPTQTCGLPLHTLKPSKKSVSHTRSTVETGRLLANQVMNHSEQMDINSTFNRFNSSRASLGGWQWLEAGSVAWFHPMSVTWARHSKHILEWPEC